MNLQNSITQWLACVRVMSAAFILFISTSILVGCRDAISGSDVQPQQTQQLHVEIPQSNWVPIFFKEIDKRVQQANLANLRTALLPGDDLEVRLWLLGGYEINGIVIRRASGAWSATYLHEFSTDPNSIKNEEQMRPPRSGWESAWQKLVDSDLLTMPDASQINCNVMGKDGMGYIVETNMSLTYRTYLYDLPAYAKCDEAKQLLNLISIVNEEFGTKWPTTK